MTTSNRRVTGVCGSLQAESSNLNLLHEASRIAPRGFTVQVGDHLRHLPLFNPDLLETPPPVVLEWRAAILASDAVLIACPEYGHSLPGALKNGIDWLIGSGELYRKVVAITASVRSLDRGRRGLSALRQTLQAVDARVIWDEPLLQGDEGKEGLAELLSRISSEQGEAESGRQSL